MDGYKAHEKMLNINNYQRNANQNYNEVPVRMAIINKNENSKCWRGCGEKEIIRTVGGNVHWHIHYGKQY